MFRRPAAGAERRGSLFLSHFHRPPGTSPGRKLQAIDLSAEPPALDLPQGTLAAIAEEPRASEGRLALVACRLADALDPAPCGR
jgi:hypothetical protein